MLFLGLVCLLLAAATLGLGLKLWLLYRGLTELEEGVAFCLSQDTNTLLRVSVRDARLCRFAHALSKQLAQLRRQRQQYQQGDQELKEAVCNLSHDLRTPLTAVFGYLELLRRQNLPSPSSQYLAQIENRCQAMKQLLEELFRYSVILANQQEPDLKPVSLNGMLEESLAAYYAAFTGRGIAPSVSIPETPVLALGDPKWFSRIFSNILSNILKYSDGDFQVSLTPAGEIAFSKPASKLSAVEVQRLFNRFFTLETGRSSTGLGLSIAKLLTQQLRGEIDAEYREGWLTVRLKFPLAN